MLRYRAMGEADELREQAARAVEEALRQRAVGLFRAVEQQGHILGAGTLVEWNGRQLVLTAEHVIRGIAPSELRFFLPSEDIPQNVIDRSVLLNLEAAHPAHLEDPAELAIAGVEADAEIDLAAIDITGSLTEYAIPKFFRIVPGGATPPEGTHIVSRGYPFDLARVTAGNVGVAFMAVHWSDIVEARDGLQNFEPECHFLTRYEFGDGSHPKGMSGSAGCYSPRKGDGQLWVADLEIAGVTISYYQKPQLLSLVRREKIEEFLTDYF